MYIISPCQDPLTQASWLKSRAGAALDALARSNKLLARRLKRRQKTSDAYFQLVWWIFSANEVAKLLWTHKKKHRPSQCAGAFRGVIETEWPCIQHPPSVFCHTSSASANSQVFDFPGVAAMLLKSVVPGNRKILEDLLWICLFMLRIPGPSLFFKKLQTYYQTV